MQKKKNICIIISFILLSFVIFNTYNIFAVDPSTIFTPDQMPDPGSNKIERVNTSINRVWGSVTLILQVASVTAVVFAGVRYMFASADQKADIKKSMIYLVVGAIFVFSASTVINFVVKAFQDIVK